ncbi:MAG: MBL fold metallo-hydrolase [Candidatus Micrarchaeota archaeon]
MAGETASNGPVMRIRYHGVRGSLPAPLTPLQVRKKMEVAVETIFSSLVEMGNPACRSRLDESPKLRIEYISNLLDSMPLSVVGTYSGNTTCLEVQVKDSPLIVLDMGSGARMLGNELAGRFFSPDKLGFNPLSTTDEFKNQIHVLLTHVHWDHIQGFPFFAPAFFPGVDMKFYGRANSRQTLEETLRGQQQFPNFPVEFIDLPSSHDCKDIRRMAPPTIRIGAATINAVELSHPDGVFAYKIEAGQGADKRIYVLATDTEHRDILDPRLVKLAKDAHILYYDAQYLPGADYAGKFDWGHSTYEWAVKTALAANVQTVVLGHFEPTRDDFGLAALHKDAVAFADAQLALPENKGKFIRVVMGYEGLVQEL